MKGISIIVPIKVDDIEFLSGFSECYQNLLNDNNLNARIQLIIPDTSSCDIYNEVSIWFDYSNVIHFRPECEGKNGHNGKLISVQDALKYVTYDHVLLLDDDYRPSPETINALYAGLLEYSCFKCMITYKDPSIHDLINLCGIFVINLLHPHRQFCGHIGFKYGDLLQVGMPDTNLLYDELAIENRFRKAGKRIGYGKSIFLEMVTHGTRKFLEQRIRYAYENMAYPLRFILYLCVVPLLIIAFLHSHSIGLLIIAIISICVLILTFLGQMRYGGGRFNKLTWLWGIVWFWPYPFTSWIALLMYIKGGIKFGGQRIRRAA